MPRVALPLSGDSSAHSGDGDHVPQELLGQISFGDLVLISNLTKRAWPTKLPCSLPLLTKLITVR